MLQSPQIKVHTGVHSMRAALLFFVMSLLTLVGCKEHQAAEVDDGWATWDPDMPDDDCCGPVEDEEVDVPDTDLSAHCKLDDTFFNSMPLDWTSFFTMKMMGLINDPSYGNSADAFLWKIKTKLKGVEYDVDDYKGLFLLDTVTTFDNRKALAVVAKSIGSVNYLISNKLVSFLTAQTFFLVDDLQNWKAHATHDGSGGVYIDGGYKVTVSEIWSDNAGPVQNIRMECVRGISIMNWFQTGYEGSLFVCTDKNIVWDVGEVLKIMSYSNMTDEEAEILAVLNRGLLRKDPNYRTDVCRCYESDGMTLMDCEDMKDEFGLGELPDDDTMIPDDDILVEKCGNGVLEAGEECDAGMSIPCVEIDPVQFSTGDAPCKDDCSGWDVAVCIEQNSGNDDE